MTLLVTSYYPLGESFHTSEDRDWDNRLEHFLRMARLEDVNVLVFTDETHGHLLRARIEEEGMHRVDVNSTRFPDFRTTTTAKVLLGKCLHLPVCRHPEKDSIDYMVLQICKTEFVAAALDLEKYRSMNRLAWFDFSLARLFPPNDCLLSRLDARFCTNLPGRITLPGCWDVYHIIDDKDLFQRVCWRFCGGFFCGDRQAIAHFYKAVTTSLLPFVEASHGVLAWEVNVWAWMEKHGHQTLFQWYPGDHNDTIL
jgi:hypothetical protein